MRWRRRSAGTAGITVVTWVTAALRAVTGVGEGETTSGTFSPTLERSIAFARVPAKTGDRVQVDIRGKLLSATVVKPPFVRNGKPRIDLAAAK